MNGPADGQNNDELILNESRDGEAEYQSNDFFWRDSFVWIKNLWKKVGVYFFLLFIYR